MVLGSFHVWHEESFLSVVRSNPNRDRFQIEKSEKSDGVMVTDSCTGVSYIFFRLGDDSWSVLSDDLDQAWYESTRPAALRRCWEEIDADAKYFALGKSALC